MPILLSFCDWAEKLKSSALFTFFHVIHYLLFVFLGGFHGPNCFLRNSIVWQALLNNPAPSFWQVFFRGFSLASSSFGFLTFISSSSRIHSHSTSLLIKVIHRSYPIYVSFPCFKSKSIMSFLHLPVLVYLSA